MSLTTSSDPLRTRRLDTLREQAGRLGVALWPADQLATALQPVCPSGHAALDAELPGGGWPAGCLSELLLAGPGQGEWRLLAPALAALAQGRAAGAGQELVFIAPPLQPCAATLAGWGLPLQRLLWVRADDPADAAWAAEQALRHARCAGVVWWALPPDTSSAWPSAIPCASQAARHPAAARRGRPPTLDWPTALRRLHLAAQGRNAWLWVLRPLAAARQTSPAPLRLSCRPDAGTPGRLQLQLLKRRGPQRTEPLWLDTRAALGAVLAHRLAQPLPAPRVLGRPAPPVPRTPALDTALHPPSLTTPPSPTPHSATASPAPDVARAALLCALAVPAPAAPAAGRAGALVG